MNILLSVQPEELFLGIASWILIVLGILVLVKFFQIASDVSCIKDSLVDISSSLTNKDKEINNKSDNINEAIKKAQLEFLESERKGFEKDNL